MTEVLVRDEATAWIALIVCACVRYECESECVRRRKKKRKKSDGVNKKE